MNGKFQVKANVLMEMINKVKHSTASSKFYLGRYYLTGIMFESNRNTLRLVTTDGHRLAIAEVSHEKEPSGDLSFMISNTEMEKLILVLNCYKKKADADVVCKFFISGENLVFECGEFSIKVNLNKQTRFPSQSQFPNYREVVPSGELNHVTATLNTKFINEITKQFKGKGSKGQDIEIDTFFYNPTCNNFVKLSATEKNINYTYVLMNKSIKNQK